MKRLTLVLALLALLAPALLAPAASATTPSQDSEAKVVLDVSYRAARANAVSNIPLGAWTTPARRLATQLHRSEPELKFVAGSRATLSKVKPLTVVVDVRSTKTQLILWVKARVTGHLFRLTGSSRGGETTVRVH